MTTTSIGIIGAGPGGVALGILLRRAGFHDSTIFDREDGVGGTWRINTYPQWPRSARAFWSMTRRFRAADCEPATQLSGHG